MRENGTFAFIMEQKALEYYTQNNCGLTQIGGLLNERNYAIAMAKGNLRSIKCMTLSKQIIEVDV